MVFSSVLLYLDPPHWQQQPNHQPALQGSGVGGRGNDHNPNQHLIPPPPLPQPPQSQVVMGGGGDGGPGAQPIHPHLTAERARLAKIHPPVTPLKCPRCESTITKFCYYNNYNLSQPRHFCKSCRRYWTQGGALRNVPVGGGCRRSHKRSSSKSSSGGGGGGGGSGNGFSSKSPPTAMVGGDRLRMPLHMDLLSTSCTSPTISGIPSAGGGTGMSPFMASLQNIAQLGMGNLGLSFGGSLNMPPHHHPLGGFSGEDGSDLHQLDFPQLNPNSNNQQMRYSNTFLEGFEIPSSSVGAGLYNSSFQQHHHQQQQQQQKFDDDDHHDHDDQVDNLHKSCPSSMNSQFEPVKMEVIGHEGLNINKQFMGAMSSSDNNAMGNRFWDNSIGNGNNIAASSSMWTHLSGLNNSSSTSHLL